MPNAARGRLSTILGASLLATAKALTIAFGIDAIFHADSPRFRGKAMRPRAVAYVTALGLVPFAWVVSSRRGAYPIGTDLAVTAPLLLDAGGNAFGIYNTAHVDDVVHSLNASLVTIVVARLAASHVDRPWKAVLLGAGAAVVGETAWETLEYTAYRLGQEGMNLSYADTMDDIYVTWVGAGVGALIALATLRARPEPRPAARRA